MVNLQDLICLSRWHFWANRFWQYAHSNFLPSCTFLICDLRFVTVLYLSHCGHFSSGLWKRNLWFAKLLLSTHFLPHLTHSNCDFVFAYIARWLRFSYFRPHSFCKGSHSNASSHCPLFIGEEENVNFRCLNCSRVYDDAIRFRFCVLRSRTKIQKIEQSINNKWLKYYFPTNNLVLATDQYRWLICHQ